MLDIQVVASQILNHNPKQFYAFCGIEYGVKCKYIDSLYSYYGNIKEYQSVSDVISFVSVNHIVPAKPSVYVVRYDEQFIASLNAKSEQMIDKLKFNGTIVCIYEDQKHLAKLEKNLPNYTVSIDQIDKKFVFKYLKNEFPLISDHVLSVVADSAFNYANARNICKSISVANEIDIYSLSDSRLRDLFLIEKNYSLDEFKHGIASRNFAYVLKCIDNTTISLDSYMYGILSVMTELEKVLCSKFTDSNYRKYAELWKLDDVYNMFMQTYRQLTLLRTVSSDTYASLVYLFSFLRFSDIPAAVE